MAQLPRLVDERAVAKEVARVTERNRRLLGRPSGSVLPGCQLSTGARPAAAAVLLRWVQAVASFYGAVVDDFGASFADGRVMCFLVRWSIMRLACWCLAQVLLSINRGNMLVRFGFHSTHASRCLHR